jgi:hypothetical protein
MAAVKKNSDLVFLGREHQPIHLHFDWLEHAASLRETDHLRRVHRGPSPFAACSAGNFACLTN